MSPTRSFADRAHGHEPAVGPIYDADGRCLVCLVAVREQEIEGLRGAVAALRWALGQVTDVDGCSAEDLVYARKLVAEPTTWGLLNLPTPGTIPEAGECDGCMCCSRSGCRQGDRSDCPTDSLGESVCPCTVPV